MKLKSSRPVLSIIAVMIMSGFVIGSYTITKLSPATASEIKTSYAPVDVEMELKKVGDHSWYVQGKAGIATDNAGFISNAGVVITDAGVLIFDALGTPSLANKLLQKIREKTDKPIVKVVVSHYHADHIYGLQVFKEQGAEIIAPDGVYNYIDSEVASSRLEERQFSLDPWVNEKTIIVKPDTLLDGTHKFSVGEINFTINVIGKAHSDADLTLSVENDRVLFTGDIIFEGRVPFIGDNSKHWLETLQNMETRQVQALVPGHGPAANNPQQAITLTREYLAYMREKMGAALEEMLDFDEAYNQVDWSKYEKLPAFEAANRRNAFQVYLSMEAEGI
jgi:glyoxylase-like metal-dependent hydrolase (beta-lactamase superfamily II)